MNRLLILGGGVSGMAAARLARRRGLACTIYDEVQAGAAMAEGFGVATGQWDRGLLDGVDVVVASPGFSERSLAIVESLEAGLPVWSEIEFAWRHLTSPVVAVTGTNGKTTVTEATSGMLEASGLNAPATGNIGSPLSDYTETNYDAVVVEVSSFQLRFIEAFHPMAAAVTNVAGDHLDWHGSEYSYRSAKARIYSNMTESDLLVFDADDAGAVALVQDAEAQLFPVSSSSMPPGGGGVDDGVLTVGDVSIPVAELPTSDPIDVTNLACAAALALRAGATPDGVSAGARTFRRGAHRRTTVAQSNGVIWVDDSKATNPHSALASIRAHESVVLVAGGLAKGLDVTPLAGEPNVRVVVGIGESGPALVEAAGERGVLAGTLDVAVDLAAEAARPGDTVLLAPGCASFDQFDSYGERGDRFAELVNQRLGVSAT